MKVIGWTLLAIGISSAAPAAGIDPRAYSCASLQALISASGYVSLGPSSFGDFAVANVSFCPSGAIVQQRGVPAADGAECPVYFCRSFRGSQ